jgi:P-type E1-E2 ATPase
VQAAGDAKLHNVADFTAVPGRGVQGTINGRGTLLGSREFVAARAEWGAQNAEWESMVSRREADGATVVYLAHDGKLAGLFAIADAPRPEAAEAVRMLEQGGLRTVMLTGDGQITAGAVAKAAGIGELKAGRTPVEKARDLRELHAAGHRPAMVGDGINDAPALVEADVGIAMGRATDIALESADMVLLGRDLRLVPLALRLSRKTFSVIQQNLFWAFFYNIATIPLAVMGVLHPIIAAGAMALSSLSVVGNSLRARVRWPEPS